MLQASFIPEYMTTISLPGGNPVTSGGTEVDPDAAANTYSSSYVEIASAAAVTTDIYFIEVQIASFALANNNRTHLLKLGLDYGSGYVDWISDIFLPAADQLNLAGQQGGVLVFPCYIPAGTAIGAKTQCATASVTNGPNIALRLFGKPRYPEATPYCTKFKSFGVTTASTTGTAIVPGVGSEGAWVDIGTLDDSYWWWQVMLSCEDTAFTIDFMRLDVSLGAAGGDRIIAKDLRVSLSSSSESVAYGPNFIAARGVSGDHLFVRAHAITGGETLYNVAAIGAK